MAIPVKLDNGATFLVEVEDASTAPGGPGGPVRPPDPDLLPVGPPMGPSLTERVERRFADVARVIEGIASEVTGQLYACEHPPSEIGLDLKLGFDASGSIKVLKGGANASLALALKWTVPARVQSPPAGPAAAAGAPLA